MSNINFTYPDEPQQNIVEVRFNSTKEGDKGDKGDKGDRGPRGYGITKVAPINISTASGGRSDYGVYGKDDEGNEIVYTQFSVYNGRDVTAQELPIIGTEPITVNRDADNNYVIGFDNSYAKLATIEDSDTIQASFDGSAWHLNATIHDYQISFVNDNSDQLGSFTLNQGEPGEINITNHIIGTGDLSLYDIGDYNGTEVPTRTGVAVNSLLVGESLIATNNNCLVIGNLNQQYPDISKQHRGAGYRDCLFSIGNGYVLNPGTPDEDTSPKTVFAVDNEGDIYADLVISKATDRVLYRDVAISYLIEKMYTTINEVIDMVNAIKNGQLTPDTSDLSKIDILKYMGLRIGWNNKNDLITHVPKNN